MKNIFKGLGIGLFALMLVVGVGAGSASAALTFATNAISENGALDVTGAVGSAIGFGTTTTTGAVNIGTSVTTGALTIGSASMTTGGTTIYGGTNASTGLSLKAASGGAIVVGGEGSPSSIVYLGSGSTTRTITIGTISGSTSVSIHVGTSGFTLDGVAASNYAIGGSATTGSITIGSTLTSGNISLGNPAAVGVGSIILNSHLTSVQTVAPLTTGSTCTTPAIAATSTDTRGRLSAASCTASQTLVAVFNRAYTTAPFCVITGSASGGVVATTTAASAYVTTTTGALTIVSPATASTAPAYNYVCME